MASPIEDQLAENIERVRGLVALYVRISGASRGRSSVADTDLLRAAVVQLHASLEDFLRELAAGRLANSDAKTLGRIPLPVGTGRKRRFTLAELAAHRGATVGDLIDRAIGAFLERSTFGNLNKVARLLTAIGLKPPADRAVRILVAAMMARRHHIGHRLDRNESTGRGQHPARSISKKTVDRWIDAVERFCRDILAQIHDPSPGRGPS